jgi:hypothetical protein
MLKTGGGERGKIQDQLRLEEMAQPAVARRDYETVHVCAY